MKIHKSIELFYKEGSSDKVYKASIEEMSKGIFQVNFAYGRRGNALTTGVKASGVSIDTAEKIYGNLLREKTGKGYVEDTSGKPFAGNLQTEVRDTGFRPQLLNEIEEEDVEKYINDDEWCAQEKFDGHRRGLLINGQDVVGTNRKGLTVAIPTEMESDIRAYLPNSLQCVFDGEAFDDHIMLFDQVEKGILYKQRYEMMKETIERTPIKSLRVVETAWTKDEKAALYNRLKKENAEGIVFKRITSTYKPGRPNSGGDQLKFKFVATATCLVTGINPTKRSVSLGVYDLENPASVIDVGNVTVYPNQDIPVVGTLVEVRYLYYFAGGSLFQPVLIGTRDDLDLDDCTLAKLKLKKEITE